MEIPFTIYPTVYRIIVLLNAIQTHSAKPQIMTLGIMQPYFFPYLGHFSLIKATDKYIVFDISQYKKYSWMNRNRILNLNSDNWMYFIVPINKHPLNTPLNSINIHNKQNWKSKIIAQLSYYQKQAPHYKKVIDFLHEVLKPEFLNLSELNIHTLKATCNYIGLDFNYEVYSKMNIKIEKVHKADEWGLNICRALGVTDFINPPGGQQFMDRQKYREKGINLEFLEFGNKPYNQKRDQFIPGLSIIDAMMFNSPTEIYQMLDDYRLIK